MADLSLACPASASVTVSGVSSINVTATGSVTITGAGEAEVTTVGSVITVSGTPHVAVSGSATSSAQKNFVIPTTHFPFTHNLNSIEIGIYFYVTASGVGEREAMLDQVFIIDANTISGSSAVARAGRLVVVAGGSAGSSSITLQQAYDAGDGTITTTALKPLELQGTGEIVAVTGTFADGITIG